MTIRRKRRQRGKRKEIRLEALKTWKRLAQPAVPLRKYDPLPNMTSVLLPRIRKIMPNTIANELVGVQPMMVPAGMIGDATSGIEPTFSYRYSYDRTKKEISEQRKKERKDKKYAKRVIKATKPSVGKISWDAINFTIRDD